MVLPISNIGNMTNPKNPNVQSTRYNTAQLNNHRHYADHCGEIMKFIWINFKRIKYQWPINPMTSWPINPEIQKMTNPTNLEASGYSFRAREHNWMIIWSDDQITLLRTYLATLCFKPQKILSVSKHHPIFLIFRLFWRNLHLIQN